MKKLLLAVAAASCAVMSAQAATVTSSFGLPVTRTTTEIDRTGSLALFDSSQGTLTGAVFDIFGQAQFAFTGRNTSAQAQNANITSSTQLTFTSSLGALSPSLPGPLNLSLTSGVQNYAVGQTRAFGPTIQNGSASSNLNGILASLQQNGGGSFTVNCTSLSGFGVTGGGGNIDTTQDTTAGCGARITYTFDAAPPPPPPPPGVPEPGSLALIGLALAGMGVVRRKSKKN